MWVRSSRCRRRCPARSRPNFARGAQATSDPRHHAFDGPNIIPLNEPSLPIVIPSIYGLKGVGFETVHGRWADLVLEQLRGSRADGRSRQLQRSTHWSLHHADTGSRHPETRGMLDYQLSLRVPDPPEGSFDKKAAKRGKQVFRHEAGCATCHQSPNFTDVLSGPSRTVPFLHEPRRSVWSRAMRPERRQEVSDDAVTRPVAARSVLS